MTLGVYLSELMGFKFQLVPASPLSLLVTLAEVGTSGQVAAATSVFDASWFPGAAALTHLGTCFGKHHPKPCCSSQGPTSSTSLKSVLMGSWLFGVADQPLSHGTVVPCFSEPVIWPRAVVNCGINNT